MTIAHDSIPQPFVCPVTGRVYESRSEWVSVGPNHSYRISVLDKRIVLCRSFGKGNLESVLEYNKIIDGILDEYRRPGQKMVIIEDYTHFTGADNPGRQCYVQFHIQRQHEWGAVLYFGMAPFLKLLMRLSRRLPMVQIQVDVRDSYTEALLDAFRVLDLPVPTRLSHQQNGIVEWKYDGFFARFHPSDPQSVIRAELFGYYNSDVIGPLTVAWEEFLAQQSPPAGKWIRHIDYTGLAKADFWAVVKAIRIHQRLDRLFPPQRRIVSGAPWFLRYFPALWWQSRQGKIAFLNSQAEISRWILQQHIQLTPKEGFWQRRRKIRHTSLESSTNSLMEFISEMQWDEPGSTPNPYDPEHPFHAIANALQVVKSDFDDLWTERDRRERDLEAARFRAEEAQRLQSAFLANVSHEIRTPLNAVIGMGDLLSSTQLDNQQADLLQTLRQSAQGLLTVINDILDLSRMQAGEFRLVNASFDLPALLDDVSRMIGYLATTKGLDFALIRSPELPPIVTGDAVRLRQILVNLAGNAVKFTEHGRVRVRANVSSHEGSLWHLQIDIEDTGPGIPEDKINDLFQPFRQLDDALSRKFGGTGLGLAIARNLSERMGGEITVKSVIQKGSVFTLALPLEESHSVVLTETSVFAIPNMPLTGHVLVAEDNRVNQKVIHGLLTRMGVEATLVNDGLQAIQALKAHPGEFACVLMDIQMPVMDGLEAVKRIRAGEAGYDEMRIPVIALTAHAMEGDRELFLKAGMDEYLSKPIKAQNLRAALAPLLLRASQ